MRLPADIALLRRAADTAALVLRPGEANSTFSAGNITAAPDTLEALALELEERRRLPAEYRLIDYPAVWLLQATRQLLLHAADDNAPMAERYRTLAEALARDIAADLANAEKSMEQMR